MHHFLIKNKLIYLFMHITHYTVDRLYIKNSLNALRLFYFIYERNFWAFKFVVGLKLQVKLEIYLIPM